MNKNLSGFLPSSVVRADILTMLRETMTAFWSLPTFTSNCETLCESVFSKCLHSSFFYDWKFINTESICWWRYSVMKHWLLKNDSVSISLKITCRHRKQPTSWRINSKTLVAHLSIEKNSSWIPIFVPIVAKPTYSKGHYGITFELNMTMSTCKWS